MKEICEPALHITCTVLECVGSLGLLVRQGVIRPTRSPVQLRQLCDRLVRGLQIRFRHAGSPGGVSRQRTFKVGAVVGLVGSVALLAVGLASGFLRPSLPQDWVVALQTLVVTFVMPGLLEELFFRGLLLRLPGSMNLSAGEDTCHHLETCAVPETEAGNPWTCRLCFVAMPQGSTSREHLVCTLCRCHLCIRCATQLSIQDNSSAPPSPGSISMEHIVCDPRDGCVAESCHVELVPDSARAIPVARKPCCDFLGKPAGDLEELAQVGVCGREVINLANGDSGVASGKTRYQRPPWFEQVAALAIFLVYHFDVGHADWPAAFCDLRFMGLAAILGVSCQEALLRTNSLWPGICMHWLWVWMWLTFGSPPSH